MLALRDQENLVNTHQTTAAAKPLNQGTRQLPPKTPGKTPFKVSLNDENNPRAFGKQTAKGNGNRLGDGKPGKDAFVTPFGPKGRVPLGPKPTNAKAKALQTPAPFGGSLKPNTSRRTSTAQRIKKAAPVAQQAQTKVHTDASQEDVPDIEYMPPKPIDLPDIPDDVTYDTTFPQFHPKNRALGLESVYGKHEVGSDGLTKKQRQFQQDSAMCDKMVDEMIMKQLDSVRFNDSSEDEPTAAPASQPQPQTSRGTGPSMNTRSTRSIPTIRSREAASALAGPKLSAAPARAPVAPKSRMPSASSLLMPKKTPRVPTNPSSMRNTAAAANSNTTVGYSKGRSVSSSLRDNAVQKPSDAQSPLSPESYMELYGSPPPGSDMWSRCRAAGFLDAQGEDGVSQELEEVLPTFEEDEEARGFQLTL
ncbi:hypothetical protein N7492_003707 [Penicillium capsulatum]|uniref:Uncharacterized protein n=1 Tax=Penicillium capsulatum TaxID=69766 RepID=A0A9W9IME2_9EURO|nr:hypothetical protein N7492_003707 [Penicillium capsulatum]KAJ6121712.1 hypothetical protein N7512_004177 [Penicillium capsulatum]